jgi:hypothetical protein
MQKLPWLPGKFLWLRLIDYETWHGEVFLVHDAHKYVFPMLSCARSLTSTLLRGRMTAISLNTVQLPSFSLTKKMTQTSEDNHNCILAYIVLHIVHGRNNTVGLETCYRLALRGSSLLEGEFFGPMQRNHKAPSSCSMGTCSLCSLCRGVGWPPTPF